MDFASLSESLSPETLAALRSHMDGAAREPEPSDKKVVYDGNTAASETAPHNSVYKKKEYWDERFATEESYDWLLKFDDLKDSLQPFLKVDSKILVVGCGNSTFSPDLYDAGFHNIVNIDYSDVVIENMRSKHSETRPEMQWVKMDMCNLTFENGSFDVVIDKAAMDALMVDEGDVWDPQQETISSVHDMCLSVSRVLSPDGLFLMISFMQPHFRTKYLMGKWVDGSATDHPFVAAVGHCAAYDWNLSFESITTDAGCLDSFLYIMQRERGRH